MTKLVAALCVAAWLPLSAHAQQIPQEKGLPPDIDPVRLVYLTGQHFGTAEALAEGCASAVVDPRKKQKIADNLKTAYRETFRKGFDSGWGTVSPEVHRAMAMGYPDKKLCGLAFRLYGPEGINLKDLIIPLHR
jgi:hypothetical protein